MNDPTIPSSPLATGGTAAFSPEMVAGVAANGHTGHLGLRYHAHGEDWIEMALPWREDLVGLPGSGVLASGPIISLLDTVTSLAVNVRRRAFLGVATIDLRVDYMRAAKPGELVIARGECYKLTRSIAFVRGLAHEGDTADPVAHAAGSFMLMDVAPMERAA